MKPIAVLMTALFLLAASFPAAAEEPAESGHHEHEEPWADRVGPGKAVEGFEESGRIKLAEKAVQRLEIKFSPARTTSGQALPLKAVLRSEGKPFVYVTLDGLWFERRWVKTMRREGAMAYVQLELKKGERLVVANAASLRAAELDLMAGEASGHSH